MSYYFVTNIYTFIFLDFQSMSILQHLDLFSSYQEIKKETSPDIRKGVNLLAVAFLDIFFCPQQGRMQVTGHRCILE